MFAAAATLTEGLADTVADLQDLAKRFMGLWRQFLPMLSLFFCLSFINTMLDSLKDTLVITAAGGGAFVIPYLTVYAVLPLSMLFLVAFSAASQRMSRSALFNIIIAIFVAFFAGFALFLYPNADVLHPHALADQLQQVRARAGGAAVQAAGLLNGLYFGLAGCSSCQIVVVLAAGAAGRVQPNAPAILCRFSLTPSTINELAEFCSSAHNRSVFASY